MFSWSVNLKNWNQCMSESGIIELICRLGYESGLRSESIGGLRTGSRETLEVTNWCHARVAHNVNYIIQRITKNSSDRIFWFFRDYSWCGNQYYVLKCNEIYFILLWKPSISLWGYILGVLPYSLDFSFEKKYIQKSKEILEKLKCIAQNLRIDLMQKINMKSVYL